MYVRLLTKILCAGAAAVFVVCVGSGAAAAGPVARTARHVSVNESVTTHMLQHHRTKLSEQGSGSGTFSCPITLNLNLSSNRATIAFTCSPRGGSFSGSGTASVHYIGTIATFKGTISVSQGSGSYRHASGGGLRISGTVQSSNYALKAKVTGSMNV
jgi:hypothetical protein